MKRREQAQSLRIDVAFLRAELTRIEAAISNERRLRKQAESDLAAERYARAAFLNTMQWPQNRRPRG